MKVWVVRGESGEYSDRTDWLVVSYSTKEQADDHARRANEFMKGVLEKHPVEYGMSNPSWAEAYEARREAYKENPYDMKKYSEFCTYEVIELDFVRHVDEYMELA